MTLNRHFLEGYLASGGDPCDGLLDQIPAGETGSPVGLRFVMQLLTTQMDSMEMARRVVQAVNAGHASGALGQEDASAVLFAMATELQPKSGTAFFHAVNHNRAMLRDAFERAVEVVPGRDDPDTVAKARRTIAMLSERNQATPADRARAEAWLQEHDRRLNMERSASQDEPPACRPAGGSSRHRIKPDPVATSSYRFVAAYQLHRLVKI
jgi:hypothetical protein